MLSGIGFLSMAILGVADVVGTQFLGLPIPGTYEITKVLMVGSLFFGVALAQAERKHVSVTLLVDHAPAPLRLVMEVVADLSIAALFALVAWFGWDSFMRAVRTDEYTQGLVEVRLWPSRLALVVGALLLVAQALWMVWERIRDRER
jgi:TRAP-type C4-dicarboxylate transport system permease small subunit